MRAKKIKSNIISIVMFIVLTVSATAYAAGLELIPLGNTAGINLSSGGIMVTGTPEKMDDGSDSPAKTAGIRAGDIIKKINAKTIETKEDVKDATENLDGNPVSIEILRSGEKLKLTINPYRNNNGVYELGLILRDGIAGIGTLTFYDPATNLFGALGHSINDTESGVLIPFKEGVIARASVSEVSKGKPGVPGQLGGSFDFDDVLGEIVLNSDCGIFGFLEKPEIAEGKDALPVVSANEIKTGPAVILANVSGSDISEYRIEISRVYTGSDAADRNMMITVTDPRLIEKTGGIVQGMSGSPIIQDGKFVGAVTHVLINDPERGFGVSVEKMFETARSSVKTAMQFAA